MHLGEALVALDLAAPFAEELRRRSETERRELAEVRANKMTAMLAEAEARYVAQMIYQAANRVDQATKKGQRPDPRDAGLVHDAAVVCGGEVEAEAEEFYCRAILKQTSRKTLERLVSRLRVGDSVADHRIPVIQGEE